MQINNSIKNNRILNQSLNQNRRTRNSGYFLSHGATQRVSERIAWQGSVCVEVDDILDRCAANPAEFIVTGEHDAIHLGPVIAVGCVVGSFECPDDVMGVGMTCEEGFDKGLLVSKQLVHLRFGAILGA